MASGSAYLDHCQIMQADNHKFGHTNQIAADDCQLQCVCALLHYPDLSLHTMISCSYSPMP